MFDWRSGRKRKDPLLTVGPAGEISHSRCLPLDTGITFPNTPDLVFIGGLGVVGQECSSHGPGCPSKLDPLGRLPTTENGV